MEIKEIANFDESILRDAENKARKELVEEKTELARQVFRELIVAETRAKATFEKASSELEELRSQIKSIAPKKAAKVTNK